jgi:phage tail sheath protein FI
MLFITSTSSATRHGVFAIKRSPASTIRSQGTSVVSLIGQFPWGPLQQVYEPSSIGDAITKFAPLGMSRIGSAYLSLIGKPWAGLRIVRVLGSTAAKATCLLTVAGPTTKVTLTAKYQGTGANSFVATVSDASDGDANHFDLAVTVTSSAGSTTDVIKNINFSGTGDDSTFTQAQLDTLQLIGVPVKTAAGRPDNGTYTFSGGTDGTIASTDYVGTAGAPDKGMSLLEAEKKVRHVVVDDCGSSLRAAVNAGLKAHQLRMGDRCVYLNGNSGQSAAAAQADVASYRQSGVAYVDPWVYIYDDTTGAERLVPPAPFLAAVAAQLSPSTSPAWKSPEVQAMLGAIVRLEAARGDAAATNTAAGISTLIKEENGGHTFEAVPNTIAPSDPTLEDLTTTRMDIYIATAFVASVRSSVDAPNVTVNRDDLVTALDGFMAPLKENQNIDPNHRPHVVDYAIPALESHNSAADYAAGDVYIPLNAQYSNGMKRIFLVMKSGTTPLTVTVQ